MRIFEGKIGGIAGTVFANFCRPILITTPILLMITPPVGMKLFVIKGITDAPLSAVVRGAPPYVILMLGGLVLMMLVPGPGLATWLPYAAGFGQ